MVRIDRLTNHAGVLHPNTVALMETRPFSSVAPDSAHGWGVFCQSGSPCTDNRSLSHGGSKNRGSAYIARYQNVQIGSTTVDDIDVAIATNRSSAPNLSTIANDLAVTIAIDNIGPGDLFF